MLGKSSLKESLLPGSKGKSLLVPMHCFALPIHSALSEFSDSQDTLVFFTSTLFFFRSITRKMLIVGLSFVTCRALLVCPHILLRRPFDYPESKLLQQFGTIRFSVSWSNHETCTPFCCPVRFIHTWSSHTRFSSLKHRINFVHFLKVAWAW